MYYARPSFASIMAALALLISLANACNISTQAQGMPQAAVGQSFSYQGRLDDGGVAANGVYDFQFALFDAETAGNAIGSSITVTNVPVTRGVFTVQLDFGNPFWQQQTFLEVQVRRSGETSFTTLTPRQRLTAAPVASALPGVFTNQSAQFVGIGRSNRITSNEVFGVTADFGPTGNTYGGMYINTTSPQGRPFYGYATNGMAQAWTTYNPDQSALEMHSASGLWLSVSNNRVAQSQSGNGLIKAGVFANCHSSTPSIVRSFVNISNAAPTATISWNGTLNSCVIDFGFTISGRYYVATANGSTPLLVNCVYFSTTALSCNRFNLSGAHVNGNIIVLVY